MFTGSRPFLACSRLMISIAHLMMVRVRRPRKSNFTRPAASTSSLSNWVTSPPPSSSQAIGEKSVSLVGAITTPPACLPVPRVMPSSEGHLPDLGGFLVALEEVAEHFFLLVGLIQGHADFERDHLRQPVGETVGLALDPRHVAYHRLRRHGAEGDDLAHRVAPVGVGHVVDHPVATLHAEVDVEVGHGNPFRVEETFEQQIVGQRIEVGDLQHVGHQRAGARAPPGPTGTPLFFAHLMKSITMRK